MAEERVICAGIDECGYGPILGPLVVASSIFLVKENPEIDMWPRLQKSVGKSRKGLSNRILVCDSKKAYSRQTGFGCLEQTVRAFLNQLHLDTTSFSSILPIISNNLIKQIDKYPWYVPLYNDHLPEINQSISNALTENMKQEGIDFVDFRCICMDVEEFNSMVTSTGNKATVVLNTILRLLRRLQVYAHFCGVKKIVVFCDRLGGRTHYGNMLKQLPPFTVRQAKESSKLSEYELSTDKIDMHIQFEVGADDKHFTVALSSMVGKYIREKLMQYMNNYFTKLQPGLVPTAGYWTDGWRFLKDLKDETLDKAGLEREDLVRIK